MSAPVIPLYPEPPYHRAVCAYLNHWDELSYRVQSDGGFLEGPSCDGAVAWIGGEAELIRAAYDAVTGKTSSEKGGNDDRVATDVVLPHPGEADAEPAEVAAPAAVLPLSRHQQVGQAAARRPVVSTRAELDAALAAEIRPVLEARGAICNRDDPEWAASLVADLVGLMSGYAARRVDERARSPRSQRGPGRQQRREQSA